MNDEEQLINQLGMEFNKTKRKTQGRDKENKQYHKITISVSKKEKEAIQKYAYENNISVSQMIKKLLLSENII